MTIDGITYLNPDAVNGLNLYAYCGNNPVVFLDPNGEMMISSMLMGAALLGAVVGWFATMMVDIVDDVEVFNGSITPFNYFLNTVVMAIGVATIYSYAPNLSMLALAGGGYSTVVIGSAIAISVIIGAAVLMFAKDGYIENLKRDMSQNQKEKFQREIEDYKKEEGRGGKDNLPHDILKDIAEYIKTRFK